MANAPIAAPVDATAEEPVFPKPIDFPVILEMPEKPAEPEPMVIEVRNAVYLEDGKIDCELNHPKYGWIPFTASPDDSQEIGRLVHVEALKMVLPPMLRRKSLSPATW